MKIVPAKPEDAIQIASIISEANKDVAKLFNITIENTPKHPSFCTDEWVRSGFERGEAYFLYKENGVAKGCVAFEQPNPDTAYLNRLSVLPKYRHNGIGASLVRHIIDYSRIKKDIRTISIGIIAEHIVLKAWYVGLGFVEGDIMKFKHLPFNVQYLRYRIRN